VSAYRAVEPCDECGRLMRGQKASEEMFPGTVKYAADGLCKSCYNIRRRAELSGFAPTIDDAHTAATNYGFLKSNSRIELVKWVKDDVGWDYRTVRGTHRGHTDTHWQVEVLGEVVEYDRTVWEVTVP
jgi:hypothetical protein